MTRGQEIGSPLRGGFIFIGIFGLQGRYHSEQGKRLITAEPS